MTLETYCTPRHNKLRASDKSIVFIVLFWCQTQWCSGDTIDSVEVPSQGI